MASHTACASWQGWLEGWTQLGLLTGPSKMAFPTWKFLGSENSTMATGFPQSMCPNRIRQNLHGLWAFSDLALEVTQCYFCHFNGYK